MTSIVGEADEGLEGGATELVERVIPYLQQAFISPG